MFTEMKFQKLYDRISRLKVDLKEVVRDVLSESDVQQRIIEKNQEQLYDKGIQADGSSTGTYSPRTIKIKAEKGQKTSFVTLKDTGEFYRSMKVETDGAGIKISGDMIKPTQDLEDLWPKALGLTNESKAEILEEIKGRVVGKFREKTA